MSTIQDTDLLVVNRGGTDYKVTAADLKDYFYLPPPEIVGVTSPDNADYCTGLNYYIPGDVVEAEIIYSMRPGDKFQWYIYDYFAGPDGVKEIIGHGKTLTITKERVNGGNVWVRILDGEGNVVSKYDAFNGSAVALDVLQQVEVTVYVTPERAPDGTPSTTKFVHKVIFEKMEWAIGNEDLIPCDDPLSVWMERLTYYNVHKHNFYDDRGDDSYSVTDLLWPGDPADNNKVNISFYTSNDGAISGLGLAQYQCIQKDIIADFVYVNSIDDIPPQMTFSKKPVTGP